RRARANGPRVGHRLRQLCAAWGLLAGAADPRPGRRLAPVAGGRAEHRDRAAVTAAGAEYVDVRTPGEGHDACQSPGEKWIEGYVPTAAAAPLHPNRRGEENYARIVHQLLA